MPSVHLARLRQISAALLLAIFATPGFIILVGVWISTAVIYARVDRFLGISVGDGELRNMRWQWDGNDYFASLSSPQLEVTLGVGVHTITLFIQNSRLMTATDTVTMTVLAQDSATPTPTDTAGKTSEPTSSPLPAAR